MSRKRANNFQAVTSLKRSQWHSPLNWKVLINLGLVNLHTGQAASAFNFICAAVNIRPDLGQTFMLLGCSLLELNDWENAQRAFTQALTINPDDPYIVINSCLCFFLTGHRDSAINLLERYKNLTNGYKNEELNKLYAKLDLHFVANNDTAKDEVAEDDKREEMDKPNENITNTVNQNDKTISASEDDVV